MTVTSDQLNTHTHTQQTYRIYIIQKNQNIIHFPAVYDGTVETADDGCGKAAAAAAATQCNLCTDDDVLHHVVAKRVCVCV